MPRLSLMLATFFVVLSSSTVASVFNLNVDELSPNEIDTARRLLADVESRLPPSLKSLLSRKLTIRFVTKYPGAASVIPVQNCDHNKDSSDTKEMAQEPSRGVVGLFEQGRWQISIHRHFLWFYDNVKDQTVEYDCMHLNRRRQAIATLVHETFHAFDIVGQDLYEGRYKAGLADSNSNAPYAINFRNQLLDVLSFNETGFFWQTRGQQNYSVTRSPDPYEFENTEEGLAVNFEYFIMDEEYACRRPAAYQVFSRIFSYHPFQGKCQLPRKVNVRVQTPQGIESREQIVDEERVYQIEHLLSTSSEDSAAAGWGHSMYRIVICDQSRTHRSKECLRDIHEHLVLSFVGNIDDVAMNTWKGVTGGYTAQMHIVPFVDVKREVTELEFRELYTIPLNLTRSEVSLFLDHMLEVHYQYLGRYRFFTNNCATEALNFLKAVLPHKVLQRDFCRTPTGLHEWLQEMHFCSDISTCHPNYAAKNGLLFRSSLGIYKNALSDLYDLTGVFLLGDHRKQPTISENHIRDYVHAASSVNLRFSSVSDLALDRRRQYCRIRKQLEAYPAKLEIVTSIFEQIEENIAIRAEAAAKKLGGKLLFDALEDKKGPLFDLMTRYIKDSNELVPRYFVPWAGVTRGYGVVLANDQASPQTNVQYRDFVKNLSHYLKTGVEKRYQHFKPTDGDLCTNTGNSSIAQLKNAIEESFDEYILPTLDELIRFAETDNTTVANPTSISNGKSNSTPVGFSETSLHSLQTHRLLSKHVSELKNLLLMFGVQRFAIGALATMRDINQNRTLFASDLDELTLKNASLGSDPFNLPQTFWVTQIDDLQTEVADIFRKFVYLTHNNSYDRSSVIKWRELLSQDALVQYGDEAGLRLISESVKAYPKDFLYNKRGVATIGLDSPVRHYHYKPTEGNIFVKEFLEFEVKISTQALSSWAKNKLRVRSPKSIELLILCEKHALRGQKQKRHLCRITSLFSQ